MDGHDGKGSKKPQLYLTFLFQYLLWKSQGILKHSGTMLMMIHEVIR